MRWVPRFLRARDVEPPNDIVERFGLTCPICYGLLGRPADQDYDEVQYTQPPALLLEVGPAEAAGYPWRLSYVDGNPWWKASDTPPFSAYEVDFVYLLCGNGHIFGHSSPAYGYGEAGELGKPVEGWNIVAMIGSTGSGKTYLTLRALSQSLVNEANLYPTAADRMQVHELSPLERVTTAVRREYYEDTLSRGIPIPSTGINVDGTPFGIFETMLPRVLREIQQIIRDTVLDGEQRAASWGKTHRQPLVLRTDTGGRPTWTGVVDLPGELFTEGHENRRENLRLRLYDAIVWVIDPVLAASARTWLPDDPNVIGANYVSLLDGSLRPGSRYVADASGSDEEKLDIVRRSRNAVQIGLGEVLSKVDGRYSPEGRARQSLLITITKCDVIHAALATRSIYNGVRSYPMPRGLECIGPPHLVRNGVTKYLVETANRYALQDLRVDDDTRKFLDHLLRGADAQPRLLVENATVAADGLLAHYSQPDDFWRLVHTGEADQVTLGGPAQDFYWVLPVPSVGDHLDQAMTRGSSELLAIRDLVMSAVGCGVACGLGHINAIFTLLGKSQRELRFFLCSPLTTIPTSGTIDGAPNLEPLNPDATFPPAVDRSAALTQLLIGILGKARRWQV